VELMTYAFCLPPAGDIENTGAGDELVVAASAVHGGLAPPSRRRDRAGTHELDLAGTSAATAAMPLPRREGVVVIDGVAAGLRQLRTDT
jgi:hypothetical protein